MDIDDKNSESNEVTENSLSLALSKEFKSAPWYVSSIGIHALVFLLLMLIPSEPPAKKSRQIVIISTTPEEVPEIVEAQPDIQETDPEVVTDNTTSNTEAPITVSADFDISDHNETDNDMNDNTAQGDPEANSTFDGDVTGIPTLMGVGNSGGTGGGGGKFGTRFGGGKKNLVSKNGGNTKTESSVDWALKWLAEHQESDGHWDCKKYEGAAHDVAVTSMASLAFLGAGNSPKFGRYKDNISRAIKWLISQQDANGCIGPHRYTGAISLMAISEAYGMTNDPQLQPIAQRCADWAVKSQCPAGGWDYIPNSQRVDTSVTGWWIMGLKSAKVSGLTIPHSSFQNALAYIEKTTAAKSQTVSVSYATDNAPTVNQVNSGGGSNRLTAVSLTCLQFLGKERNDPLVQAVNQQILNDGTPNAAACDFYRWYYATLGLFQMGVKQEGWKKWNGDLKIAMLTTQIKEGSFKENKGSWSPAIETSLCKDQWGRVGQTSLGALMLEVYYRYDDIHRKANTKQ